MTKMNAVYGEAPVAYPTGWKETPMLNTEDKKWVDEQAELNAIREKRSYSITGSWELVAKVGFTKELRAWAQAKLDAYHAAEALRKLEGRVYETSI